MTKLIFSPLPTTLPSSVTIISEKQQLTQLLTALSSTPLPQLLTNLPIPIPNSLNIHTANTALTVTTYSSERNRNSPVIRTDKLAETVSKHTTTSTHIIIPIATNVHSIAAANAISSAIPLYTKKTNNPNPNSKVITVTFVTLDSTNVDYDCIRVISDSIRLAAKLVDMPTSELNTTTYTQHVLESISGIKSISAVVIKGKELESRGFGGLWGVGKASEHLPALVHLTYTPNTNNANGNADKRIALVGKGIVYDTGGLSIKSSTSMPGMKADMGGSAALFGAFLAIAKSNLPISVDCILCLAENSISSNSTRPDDILTMYSGKTVEINNTDAEGRLVLADGVAYASKHLSPTIIIDMATLTGAQGISTGNNHAAILSNSISLEQSALIAGKMSGDAVFPILYAPEYLLSEFDSKVADLKNSVKCRTNAQSSCAGHFVEAHLESEWKGEWLHVDIAYPAVRGERGTGFGVGLVYWLVREMV